MTSGCWFELEALLVLLDELVPLAPVLVLEEQAARPAPRSMTVHAVSALLLNLLLVVNFDLSSRVCEFEKELCFCI
jgi:hypothetical protein